MNGSTIQSRLICTIHADQMLPVRLTIQHQVTPKTEMIARNSSGYWTCVAPNATLDRIAAGQKPNTAVNAAKRNPRKTNSS